jgi:hypothetical protein
MREENGLKLFENRVLMRTLEVGRMQESWINMHNGELHNLYSSPNNI